MAESAPELTARETEMLHGELLALRDALDAALAGSRESSQPVDLDEPIGRLSRIDAIAQQEMAQAGRAGMMLRAVQVRAALERIALGSYGVCSSCEENVGYPRLSARPETAFCIACQTRRERR
jgi:DnaK suppressor protein